MKKILSAALLLVLTASTLAGCSGTDVVLKYSPDSFEAIVEKQPGLVVDNTLADHYYYLTIDGETMLKISHDYDLTGTDDIMIETKLKPFADAGLDASKAGENYKVIGDMLYLRADYGKGGGMRDTITDSLFESVEYDRGALTYHKELDHYGIVLGAGKFEWAKDFTTNDKDIVFVLKAQPLKDMGADVSNIEGWTLASVQEDDGSSAEVLLKAYDLN